jgi:hypothetical protein
MSANCRAERSNAAIVSTVPMSPMCWLIHAPVPLARQKAFFSSPPTARVGVDANGSRIVSGEYPRDRRIGRSSPSTTRTTESSHGT